MLSNSAAWLPAKAARLAVAPAPYTAPREDEIVVRNHAVAINPVDWIKQTAGDFVFPWIKYPFVLGSDLAGDVVAVGSAVSRFNVGDRVVGHAVGSDPKRNSAAEGAFQSYTVLLAKMASPIPDDLSYQSAAVLPLGLSTAACGLFHNDQLALDRPSVAPKRNGKTVIVWGGSTSVGSNAIQLAVAAGYDVIATASPKNFEYVKRLGASQAFDYNDRSAVQNVIAACKGTTIAGALAIGAGSADACVDVVSACDGTKFVSMATYPVSFTGDSGGPGILRVAGTVRRFVWASMRLWLRSRTRGIRTKYIFGSSLVHNDISSVVYADFLPQALAQHRYVAAPAPHIGGHGLDCIQRGLDVARNGVSAAKIVVTLQSD